MILKSPLKKGKNRWGKWKVLEDRIYIGWNSGYFLTSVGSGDFQSQLAEMVKDLGRPDVVEYRSADEGFIPGGDDLDDPDSATDIIPLRQQFEEGDDEPNPL